GWIWKRLLRFDCCRAHAHRSTIRRVCLRVLGHSHRYTVSGFLNRGLEFSVGCNRDSITTSRYRSAPTVVQRKLSRQKFVLRCEAEFGCYHPRPRSWRGEISGAVPTQDACRPG